MIRIAVHDAAGTIVKIEQRPSIEDVVTVHEAGTFVECAADVCDTTHYVDVTLKRPKAKRLAPRAPEKLDLWNSVKAHRDRLQAAGCETPIGRMDSTPQAQAALSLCVARALIAKAEGDGGYSISLTRADNSEVACSADDVIAAGKAVADHVAAQHAEAAALRKRIDSARPGKPMIQIAQAIDEFYVGAEDGG